MLMAKLVWLDTHQVLLYNVEVPRSANFSDNRPAAKTKIQTRWAVDFSS